MRRKCVKEKESECVETKYLMKSLKGQIGDRKGMKRNVVNQLTLLSVHSCA